MTLQISEWLAHGTEELIASFGDAQLLRAHDGRMELRGGTPADQLAAREWISLFMHEAVLHQRRARH